MCTTNSLWTWVYISTCHSRQHSFKETAGTQPRCIDQEGCLNNGYILADMSHLFTQVCILSHGNYARHPYQRHPRRAAPTLGATCIRSAYVQQLWNRVDSAVNTSVTLDLAGNQETHVEYVDNKYVPDVCVTKIFVTLIFKFYGISCNTIYKISIIIYVTGLR